MVDKEIIKCYTYPMIYKHTTLESTKVENVCSIEKLYSTYSYFYSKDFIFTGEYHDAWELVYVYSGSAIIETPEYTFTLSKNQALLHSPNERHKIRANNVCCSLLIFSFDCSCEEIYNIAHKPLNISPLLSNYLIIAVEEGLSYLSGKNNISSRNLPVKFASGQVIKNTLELTLISLIRSHSFDDKEHSTKRKAASNNQIVNLVIDYLKDHIQEKILLNDLALTVGYSTSHLSALFQKETGMSIKTYFNKLRIDTAKDLIAKQNMSIQQISEQLNFDSVQYFSLRFKKETGLTPSQYATFLKSQTYYHDI